MSISVHDNVLLSYSVSAWEKEARFHTASPDDESHEYVGVIASHSKYDDFLNGRKHAWPVACESKEGLLRWMHEEDVRAFGVQSSRSLYGWVWAQSVTRTGTGRR